MYCNVLSQAKTQLFYRQNYRKFLFLYVSLDENVKHFFVPRLKDCGGAQANHLYSFCIDFEINQSKTVNIHGRCGVQLKELSLIELNENMLQSFCNS